MWKQLSAEFVKATYESAVRFRDMQAVPRDRPVMRENIRYLRGQIDAGASRPFCVATCYCLGNRTLYRVNGKHSCITVADHLEVYTNNNLWFCLERYQADTIEDVIDLYNTYDLKRQGRSAPNVYYAVAGCDPQLAEVRKDIIKNATAGIYFSDADGKEILTTPECKAKRLREEKPFVGFLATIMSGGSKGERKSISRAPVVAAMLRTFRSDSADACKFWMSVKTEDSPNRDCPTRVLARYLKESTVVRGGSAKEGKKASDRREMFVKCIHAWNAWRNGASTKLKYHPHTDIPRVA